MKIAMIEDEQVHIDALTRLLCEFHDTYDAEVSPYEISVYNNGDAFLRSNVQSYDLVFMDIEMPGLDGMTTAKLLRQNNSLVKLVFVTQMSQYAIEGYQVMAYDYILKPIKKARFFSMMKRCMHSLSDELSGDAVQFKTQFGQTGVVVSSIRYVEVFGHRCIVHADKDYEVWMGLGKIEELLSGRDFFRISKSYLVNLKYVKQLKGYEVTVGGDVLTVGRDSKKEFQRRLAEYLGR